MVGKYQRKSTRQNWDEGSMRRAINAVHNGEMGWLRAAKLFGVPQATLRRRARNSNKFIRGVSKGLGRFRPTFEAVVERELVEHLKLLESRLFGMTVTDVRKLAYELAERSQLEHRFSHDTKMAGWDWLAGFRSRNPDIALRKPEATSAARAMAFNRTQVAKFFELYQSCLEKHKIDPTKIYNVDESALSTVQKPPKVFAQSGKKQVGALTSAERGVHVTMVCCMSTVGHFIPPALIFPRKRWKNELIDGAPLGTLGLTQENGWMTGDVFLQWLEHFRKYAKPNLDEKVLLIVDGHSSHKSLQVLTYAKNNGIVMLCLPPHTTHRLQPLDVSFYGPMKTYYDQEVSKWLKANPGRVVTQFQIASLFSAAYCKAAQTSVAQNGFAKTGIWPVNPEIFPDYLFAPAETTNLEENEVQPLQQENIPEPIPTTSRAIQTKEKPTLVAAERAPRVKLSEISPIPQKTSRETKRKRKSTGSQILTTTPNLEEQKQKADAKAELERRKTARQVKKRLVIFPEDAYEEPDPFGDAHTDDENDVACLFCNDLYSRSKPNEFWLKCQICSMWAHAECSGNSPKAKSFILCDLCI